MIFVPIDVPLVVQLPALAHGQWCCATILEGPFGEWENRFTCLRNERTLAGGCIWEVERRLLIR